MNQSLTQSRNRSHNRSGPRWSKVYLDYAIAALDAARLGEKARLAEIQAKKACVSQMNAVGLKSFAISVTDEVKRNYRVDLTRPVTSRVDPRKLYNLVKEQQISIDDFLECVFVSERAVSDLFPTKEKVDELRTLYKKKLDLVFTEVSQ